MENYFEYSTPIDAIDDNHPHGTPVENFYNLLQVYTFHMEVFTRLIYLKLILPLWKNKQTNKQTNKKQNKNKNKPQTKPQAQAPSPKNQNQNQTLIKTKNKSSGGGQWDGFVPHVSEKMGRENYWQIW